MVRLAAAFLLCLCATAIAAPDARHAARAKAVVKVERCSREDRSALFYARMRATPATERMKLHFTLLRRGGDGRWHKVDAPGLATWRTAEPGVEVFGYHQEVRGLEEGSAYRTRVRYRWYGEGSEPIKRKRRRSRICRQYERLPNLRIRPTDARSTDTPGVWRYEFRVRNSGAVGASDVGVQLEVDGAVIDTRVIDRLRSAERRSVRFRGPACGARYAAEVDPEGAIAEGSETDNRALRGC